MRAVWVGMMFLLACGDGGGETPDGSVPIDAATDAATDTPGIDAAPTVAQLVASDASGNPIGASVNLTTAAYDTVSTTSITITNQGEQATGALSVAVAGDHTSLGATTCQGATLAGGASCQLDVSFDAMHAVGTFTGTLVVSASPGGSLTVVLSGTGLEPIGDLTVVRNGTGFGTVTSTPAGIACGSTCTASLGTAVLAAAATPGSKLTGWSIASCGAMPTCTVPASATPRSVTATFDPAPLEITHAPWADSKDRILVNTTTTATYHLATTTAAVPIDSIAVTGDFTFDSTTCGATIPAASSCDVVLHIMPADWSSFTGTLDVVTGGIHHTVPLHAQGASRLTVIVDGLGTVVSIGSTDIACGPNSTCTTLFDTIQLDAGGTGAFTGWSNPSCGTNRTCTLISELAPTTITAHYDGAGSTTCTLTHAAGLVLARHGSGYSTVHITNDGADPITVETQISGTGWTLTTAASQVLAGYASTDATATFAPFTVGETGATLTTNTGCTIDLGGTGAGAVEMRSEGHGTVAPDGRTLSLTPVKVIATPDPGYKFAHWVNGPSIGYPSDCVPAAIGCGMVDIATDVFETTVVFEPL